MNSASTERRNIVAHSKLCNIRKTAISWSHTNSVSFAPWTLINNDTLVCLYWRNLLIHPRGNVVTPLPIDPVSSRLEVWTCWTFPNYVTLFFRLWWLVKKTCPQSRYPHKSGCLPFQRSSTGLWPARGKMKILWHSTFLVKWQSEVELLSSFFFYVGNQA